MPSNEFATTLATIAAKAAERGVWSVETCVNFAWFSVGQVGDAAEDDGDFARHVDAFTATW